MYKIVIQTSFPGYHQWKDAPEKFDYLRYIHRHVFHVRAEMEVTHDNRDIEFINLKDEVNSFIFDVYYNQTFPDSCEMIAQDIAEHFGFDRVEVLEDNENGGIYIKDSCKCKE